MASVVNSNHLDISAFLPKIDAIRSDCECPKIPTKVPDITLPGFVEFFYRERQAVPDFRRQFLKLSHGCAMIE
jgi:hypothetical protein